MKATLSHWFIGDNTKPLCSGHCADKWETDNTDADMDSTGWRQLSGFVRRNEDDEILHGDKCAMCGKRASIAGVLHFRESPELRRMLNGIGSVVMSPCCAHLERFIPRKVSSK